MASGGGDWKDMYKAAERGDVQCVRFHLSEGVDADYQHPEVMLSALVVSIIQGHTEVARVLLEHGANPNLPAQLGSLTPLQAARQYERTELQQLLQTLGAKETAAARTRFWQRWLPV